MMASGSQQMNLPKADELDYIHFLIAAQKVFTCTEAARCQPNTTHRDKHAIAAPDLVKRNFNAIALDRLWTADITYVHTQEGFLYLAFILDVYSRKVG
jgi:putative transposase